MIPTRGYAQQLDREDELAGYREAFYNTDPDLVYMDGNSLGRLPLRTIERMQHVIQDQWGTALIRSWGENWFDAATRVGDKIAPLVGASSGEVAVSDSTTVNLYKLVMAALMLRPERQKIVTDVFNFPSDLYVLQGCNHVLKDRYQIHLMPSKDDMTVDMETVFAEIDEDTALVTLSHVVFKSGFMYDAAAVTRYAHEKGALVLWDLSHSAGSVPVALDEWGADFAVGCTYKYLNGGPGAPAFLYVNKALQSSALSPIWGWFGDNKPFAFDLTYQPEENIRRFITGTTSVLSVLAMESGVELLAEVGMERLRKKSIALTSYMIELVDEVLTPYGFKVGTPRDPAVRGSHVSIRHPEGYRINRALIEEMNVIPDFREPDNLRLGLAPLYTSFEDVWQTVERIRIVMSEERYLHYPATRAAVT